MSPQEPLTVHLFSFGYRYSGVPPDEGGHGGGFVFDCRALPNPHWDEALRPHTGLAAPVVAFFAAQPAVQAFAEHATALVLQAARRYREQGRARLMVSCGCTGGRHRSVYLAECLARALREAGFTVALRHLDVERPPGANPPRSDPPRSDPQRSDPAQSEPPPGDLP